MPKVRTTVNLLDENRRLLTLHPGDEIPEWALSIVTNPAVLAADDEFELPAPIVPSPDTDPEPVEAADYSGLDKKALVALCEERELDAKGTKDDLIARLEESDKGTEGDEEVDLFSLDADELKKLAAERGINIGDASTDVEIATVIQQAGE